MGRRDIGWACRAPRRRRAHGGPDLKRPLKIAEWLDRKWQCNGRPRSPIRDRREHASHRVVKCDLRHIRSVVVSGTKHTSARCGRWLLIQRDQMPKVFLLLALAIAVPATVPATAGPYCHEHLAARAASAAGAKRCEMPAPIQTDQDEAHMNRRRQFLSAIGLGFLLAGGSPAVPGEELCV